MDFPSENGYFYYLGVLVMWSIFIVTAIYPNAYNYIEYAVIGYPEI